MKTQLGYQPADTIQQWLYEMLVAQLADCGLRLMMKEDFWWQSYLERIWKHIICIIEVI